MNKTLSLKTLGAALACALALGASARAEIFEQILVKVNGEIFTKTDLENRQVAALRQKGVQVDLKTDEGNAALKKQLDEVTPGLMVDAVDEMLIVQRGKELGYKLSDEQFKSIVDNIRKENKLDTDALWDAALKQENMTHARAARAARAQHDHAARSAERGVRQDRRVRGRGARVLQLASERVHHAPLGDAARNPRRRAERRQGR